MALGSILLPLHLCVTAQKEPERARLTENAEPNEGPSMHMYMRVHARMQAVVRVCG